MPNENLNAAFEALKQYNWGTDLAPVAPIDEAVAATHGDAAARKELEDRLLAALRSDISRDAKDYVCRKLSIVGTAASVPTLAELLSEENHAHLARVALERIPASEAGQALRYALTTLAGNLKIGVITSIGARRDSAAIAALGGLLTNSDPSVARAAATALGDIGTAEAAKALQQVMTSTGPVSTGPVSTGPVKQAVIDAQLVCAEALLASHKRSEAKAIYNSLAGDGNSRLVRLAATRGMLACASQQG
jgi:HEAT repeat protein